MYFYIGFFVDLSIQCNKIFDFIVRTISCQKLQYLNILLKFLQRQYMIPNDTKIIFSWTEKSWNTNKYKDKLKRIPIGLSNCLSLCPLSQKNGGMIISNYILTWLLPIKKHTNRRIQQKWFVFMENILRTQHLDFVHDGDASQG